MAFRSAPLPRLQVCRLLLPILALILGSASLSAQADPTATRKVSLDLYAGATFLNPEYGPDSQLGYMAGGDLTVLFRLADVSLDLRYISANGKYVDQNSFIGGLKFSRGYRKLHPYVNLSAGHGNIHFDHPELFNNPPGYVHDDSIIYDAGAGVDYSLTRRFALKADFQIQHWKTGNESNVFTPYNASVGVIYHLPFRYLRGRRY